MSIDFHNLKGQLKNSAIPSLKHSFVPTKKEINFPLKHIVPSRNVAYGSQIRYTCFCRRLTLCIVDTLSPLVLVA